MAKAVYSDQEFASRFVGALADLAKVPQDFNFRVESGFTGKPRASSIGDCARQQLYAITDTAITDPANAAYFWPQSLGFAGQEIVARALQAMGYEMIFSGELGADHISGHPDGRIRGLDLGEEWALWDSKLRNLWGFRKIVRGIWPNVDIGMFMQMQVYMKYLGLKRAMVTMHPYDYSEQNRDVRKFGLPVAHALVHRVFMDANEKAQKLADDRAMAIIGAKELGFMVRREFNPADPEDYRFPCGFCPWVQQCIADDWVKDQVIVPGIPEEWMEGAA